MNTNEILLGDCLDLMQAMPNNSVDLVFDSPPYEKARSYGIDFDLSGQEWVDWMVPRMIEALRVCRGLVATVVQGQTRKFRWSAVPALLMADLHRHGIHLRTPPLYVRDGIPGSGGPDWLKSRYEFIICCTKGGRLQWSDNTAMGHPPKYGPGGATSHRTKDGERVKGRKIGGGCPDGYRGGDVNQQGKAKRAYYGVDIVNPGNVIDCGPAGGGHIGSKLAHMTEAPFPEKLAEFFIKSFCKPGGIVLDRFCGSGTTLAVAERLGRRWIGMDIRKNQITLSKRRIREVRRKLSGTR